MRIRLGQLRKLIRETLGAGASGSDPTDVKGFYPYEIERGTDIQGFWYRSPGRSMGSDGDPGRPGDAAEYIGFKPPAAAEPAGDGEAAAAPEQIDATEET